MSHLMTNGLPCGLRDAHGGQHRSPESLAVGSAYTAQWDRANRERRTASARARRVADPEPNRKSSREYGARNPLKIYQRNERANASARIAKLEAMSNG